MPGPSFYETFNPQDIVPLAMKKFDIDLARRKLDMEEAQHKFTLDQAKEKVAKEELFKEIIGKAMETKPLNPEDIVLGGENPWGMFAAGEPVGSSNLPSVVPKSGEITPELYLRAMIKSGLAGAGNLSQIIELEKSREKTPRSPTEVEALIGRGLTEEEKGLFITGKQATQKPTKETKFDLEVRAAKGDLGAVKQLDEIRKLEAKPKTKEMLVESALRKELGREPTENEILTRLRDEETKLSPEQALIARDLTERLGRKPTAGEIRIEEEATKKRIAEATLDVKSKDIDISALADSMSNDEMSGLQIRGSMGNPVLAKVQSEVKRKYPHFNFQMNDANYKWKSSQTNQRTINFVGGSLPRLSALVTQLNSLPNVSLNVINRVMRVVSKEIGKPEYTDFESNRNAIVQEINTALSGSATQSDVRIKIELENLKAARSPRQILGALNNLNEALIARMDVDLSPIYPIEVVRGEKSIEQYKEELFKKYRGKFDNPALAHVQGARSFGEEKNPTIPKGGIIVDPSKIKKGW